MSPTSNKSGTTDALVSRFPSAPVQPSSRAVKASVAEAYGYRTGGAPLKQIAADMEVTIARAGELLDVTHPRKLSAEYLARIARNNPAIALKLGIGAPVSEAA